MQKEQRNCYEALAWLIRATTLKTTKFILSMAEQSQWRVKGAGTPSVLFIPPSFLITCESYTDSKLIRGLNSRPRSELQSMLSAYAGCGLIDIAGERVSVAENQSGEVFIFPTPSGG
jgi:hypothetical protein